MAQLILIVAMFALLWLFLIRPQRARAQAHRDLVTKVSVGDEILTVGGLYGDVIEIDDDELLLEIAPGTQVRIARRAVAAVVPPDEEDEEEDNEEEGEKTAVLEEGESVLRDEEVRS